jgi:hypothetical protein
VSGIGGRAGCPAAGLVLRISAVDWACIAAPIGLVLTAEAFNTVVEALSCEVPIGCTLRHRPGDAAP